MFQTLLDNIAVHDDGSWYLATPYSKYVGGIEKAFQDACLAAAFLIRHGVKVYSPIAHTHPIAIHGGLDPLDHNIWLPFDEAMMNASVGLIVCQMPGWITSYGIQCEIEYFRRQLKPVYYLDWSDIR